MSRILCAAVLASALAGPVQAASTVSPATYFFYARVGTSSGGPKSPVAGSIVPISVTVDTAFPAFSHKDHGTTYYGGAGYNLPSPILAATVNGVSVVGLFDDVYIDRNYNGVYSITLLTNSFGNDAALSLTLSTTVAGVVKSERIPARVFPGNFQKATFSATFDPVDSFSGTIVE